jgi:hypothetical protein
MMARHDVFETYSLGGLRSPDASHLTIVSH